MYNTLLIKNGRVIDPANGIDRKCDVLVVDGKVAEVGRVELPAQHVIDATNRLVTPGLIDVHVHFRQPGQEYKEDIHSGSCAAAAGGFATVIAEPNTEPPIDTPARLKRVLEIADKQSVVNFFSKACISKRMLGKESVAVEKLKAGGARAISDDGHPVPGKPLMRNALKKGKKYGVLVNPHCEESEYYRKNIEEKKREQSRNRRQCDFDFEPPPPYTREYHFIDRDIKLAEETGASIHISHVSLASSVHIIAQAKCRGVKVTAEATPHHFMLSKEAEDDIGTNAKVNPPLRSKRDVEAVKQGLADGTIDMIASDHAPHAPEEKAVEWDQASFGIIGLETTLGLVLTHLVKPGVLTLNQAIEKMTSEPARVFGLAEAGIGSLKLGAYADVTIIDPTKNWKVDANRFYSKGRNCPFDGWELQGKAIMTIVRGRIVMENGEIN